MVYIANWVIIYYLPPIKGTRNSIENIAFEGFSFGTQTKERLRRVKTCSHPSQLLRGSAPDQEGPHVSSYDQQLPNMLPNWSSYNDFLLPYLPSISYQQKGKQIKQQSPPWGTPKKFPTHKNMKKNTHPTLQKRPTGNVTPWLDLLRPNQPAKPFVLRNQRHQGQCEQNAFRTIPQEHFVRWQYQVRPQRC